MQQRHAQISYANASTVCGSLIPSFTQYVLSACIVVIESGHTTVLHALWMIAVRCDTDQWMVAVRCDTDQVCKKLYTYR